MQLSSRREEFSFYFIREIRFPYGWYPINKSLRITYAFGDIALIRWDIDTEVINSNSLRQIQKCVYYYFFSLDLTGKVQNGKIKFTCVVVMPRTILPRRYSRCALFDAGTQKPEEEKDARGVTCFMEENEISLREVARFDEHKRDKVWSGKGQHFSDVWLGNIHQFILQVKWVD